MEKHISWIDAKEMALEKKILSEYSKDEVWKHLEYLATLTRVAGTEDERKAAEYIQSKLQEYGIETNLYEFDGYVGHPGKATLEILSPTRDSFSGLAQGFVAPTPPEGIEADLVFVGKGSAEDYRTVDLRGKIVLIEAEGGGDQPTATKTARISEEHGALGQIFVSMAGDKYIDIMRFRNVWGNPIPETMDQIPQTPGVSVCHEDGKTLIELARKNRVVVRLKAEAWRGYKRVRQPVGTLKGMKDPEKYMLCSAHYCSWFVGATDNAAANSLLLEMARIFSKYRKDLVRSLRFAFWTGHSQGTIVGSTWYVDNFWQDIRDNAVAYMTMDAVGRGEFSAFRSRTTEEIRSFYNGVIREALELDPVVNRVTRSGDQSFWGIGLPSFIGSTLIADRTGKGVEKDWYAHTTEDTLDKVDMEVAKLIFKVNMPSILRICNNPILPFDFAAVVKAFDSGLRELQEKGGHVLDLTPAITQLEQVSKGVEALDEAIERSLLDLEKKRKSSRLEKRIKEINACLMELSRILIPVLSSKSGKYGQDPQGTKFKPVPTLQPLLELTSIDNQSDAFRALRTSLLRERNRLSDALRLAHRTLDQTLSRI